MTTNRVVDSSFTAIITAPIDKIVIPTWMPPIVSTLMATRLPSGGQLSLQSIMTKFELGLANESQRNLSRASQKTALRHAAVTAYQLARPAHNVNRYYSFRYAKLPLVDGTEAIMPIDFTLTSYQRRLQRMAREFANEILDPLVREADEDPDPQKAFRAVKGAYVESYKLGFATDFIPKKYGGGGVSNVDLQIVVEEICAVDPGFATILLVNGLALMPLVWFASERQKQEWLVPATSDPRGEYLAGWTVSEAAGTPGGTANFDGPAPFPAGIGLTAIHDKKNGEYVLNGRKHWPANAGGWDLQGADVNVCIVRTAPEADGSRGLSAIIVPRGTSGITYEPPIRKLGHRICQNNSVVFSNCRVPEENAFAVGNGDLVVNKAFTWSGPVAAIASVGVARSAYEFALSWAKKYTGGGDRPIIEHQIVAYTLAEVAMKIEAARAFAWKAAHYHDLHNADGHAIGPMSKVFCSEMLFTAVFQAMKVVGVNALDRSNPLERYLREASVFPLYDAGNVGMQMRKICAVMAHPEFNPRAIAASAATPFGKQAPPPEIQAVGRNLKRQA